MEADDDDDAAGFERIVQDASQRCFELIELAVDGDAQGLNISAGMCGWDGDYAGWLRIPRAEGFVPCTSMPTIASARSRPVRIGWR